MKKLPLLLIIIFWGCTQPDKNTSGNPTKITFSDYVKSLDTISLPFKHSCDASQFADSSARFDSTGFKKYRYNGTVRPLGLLFHDDKNIVTVDLSIGDDCLVPFLVSFDKKGNKLDSLAPYEHAGEDSDSMTRPYFKVTKDRRIVITDTTQTWKTGIAGSEVPGSRKIITDSTIYTLSEKGRFIKAPQKLLKPL